MTTIHHETDADPTVLEDAVIAVVGYGNQGRSWALNLRDSGHEVRIHTRADEGREQAERDGFEARELDSAGSADVICLLVPDEAIPDLPIALRPDSLVVVASGYSLAFDRYDPEADVGLLAPRMLGPEVRECYLDGTGFISAVGVHRDQTGTATDRLLALAHGLGALRQGAIEMTARQEAVLDLSVEQVLAPALRRITMGFTQVMMEEGMPLEGILSELFLSGEMERTYRLLRLEGYAAQMDHHSPASQYGQLSRASRFDPMDPVPIMREVVAEISDGSFADEWDAEFAAGARNLQKLREEAMGPDVQAFEQDLRARLGEQATSG